MTRNRFGGKKHKRAKNKNPETRKNAFTVKAGDSQTYAVVLKGTGDRGLLLECEDGIQRRGVIPGKYRKRNWMRKDDILLVTIDAFGKDNKCLIEHKYNESEILDLRSQGLISFKREVDNNDSEDEIDYSEKDVSQRYVFPPSSSEEEEEDSDEFESYEDISSDEDIDLDDI